MACVFAVLRPSTFLSHASFVTIFGSQSVLVVLTLSLVITLFVGEFDLSVASILGLSATIIAQLNAVDGVGIGAAVVIALLSGIGVGLVNGLLVVALGVDALVATLGMGTLLVGLAMWMSNSITIGGISNALVNATRNEWFGLPHSFYFGILLATGLWYVMDHTPLGRHLLFVGQGREVARLSGIRVDRIRLLAFVVSGFVSALAGVIVAGTLGAYQASQSPSYLLPAFAAAFLGSTVVKPGRFNPWGSVIAIYFLITGITGLVLLGLSGWINEVFYGGALVVAVTVSTVVRRQVAARELRTARKLMLGRHLASQVARDSSLPVADGPGAKGRSLGT
jgi:ribose transport system permease protein